MKEDFYSFKIYFTFKKYFEKDFRYKTSFLNKNVSLVEKFNYLPQADI